MGRKAVVYLVTVIGATFLIAGIGALYAQQSIEATLEKASPERYNGVCPKTINFKGSITAKSPGKVQYEFVVMDGDEQTTKPGGTLDFAAAGKQEITWKIEFGEEGESKHSGWVMLRVTAPAKVESNKSNYLVRCMEIDLT